MNVVVPILYDLSSMMHGRNLRIVHLLRRMRQRCSITCVVPSLAIGRGAMDMLPDDIAVVCSQDIGAPHISLRIPVAQMRTMGFYGWDQTLANALTRLSARADVVLGFGADSANYLWAVQQATRQAADRPRTVCDVIDDPYLTWCSMQRRARLSATGMKSLICLQILKRKVLGSLDALTAVAPRDAEYLSRSTGRAVTVIPNGVETQAQCPENQSREPLIVFTGKMDFAPNEAAARHLVESIWPLIRNQCSSHDARLAIVGADPSSEVRALANVTGVEVTGRVDDLSEWLQRARVAAVPMISGSGIKNKLLEACAAGTPVVTTSLGADGLPQGESNGIVVADDPQVFADAVVRWIDDPSAASRTGQAGWQMVRAQYGWEGVTDQLLDVMQGHASESERAVLPWLSPWPQSEVTCHAAT